MQINQAYTEHVNIVKDLKMSDSFYEVREPYKEGFEEIYNKAKDENVSMSNAKEFLSSLSKEELSTLQHFSGLADDIKVEGLSAEGSYNLLLNHYERYDFKKALVDSVNEMVMDNTFLGLSMIILGNLALDGYSNDRVDYYYNKERVENVLDPANKEYPTLEFRESISSFWTTLQEIYAKRYEQSSYIQNKQ